VLRISTVNLWVHDQEVALEFWTSKVGFELRADVSYPELGGFRWLTIGPPDQSQVELVLMAVPDPPVLTEAQSELVRASMSQGLAGPVFLVTDDVNRDYQLLTSRGVEFTEPPERRPFGIDAGFRDPSGNQVRLTQELA
jgi:catechol 2,3-dioxygenase-like lactoylglutathione lyase family enzyme